MMAPTRAQQHDEMTESTHRRGVKSSSVQAGDTFKTALFCCRLSSTLL